MKKMISLIKACMTDNMSLFRIKSKNKNKNSKSKILLPIILFAIIFVYMVSYSAIIIEPLTKVHQEYVLLTLFVAFTTIMTLVEGIYKSGNLLFNCKDDNLLLSLPIKKSTVFFIRIFKFYAFELMYNSLFLVPAMLVYASYVNVSATYYLVSILAVLLLPIIPIVISCILGLIISSSSSKFKHKNIAQTIITMLILLVIFYASFNLDKFIQNIAENATSINEIISKIYYPAGAYIKLVTQFNIVDLICFVAINLLIFGISIILLGKTYFKINSKTKVIKTISKTSDYKIKVNKPVISLIKKELNRFINSPVFVINAAFGLVLFIAGCIMASIKFDSIVNAAIQGTPITVEQIKLYIPVILFGFICFSSLLSSITSSMISLEGKSFSILKSLPIKPFKIILAKILTAIVIMLPCILIGDIVVFIRFDFSIFQIIMLLACSIVLPLVAETIGILVNLKYPKMDAENDTEVVKQSMSSGIAVFVGMILSGLTVFAITKCLEYNINIDLIILGGLAAYTLICIGLLICLNKIGDKEFNKIS